MMTFLAWLIIVLAGALGLVLAALAVLVLTAAAGLALDIASPRRRQERAFRRDTWAAADALITAIQCRACRPGSDGACTCTSLCGHPACIGDHTAVREPGFTAELNALLEEGEPPR